MTFIGTWQTRDGFKVIIDSQNEDGSYTGKHELNKNVIYTAEGDAIGGTAGDDLVLRLSGWDRRK